MRYLVKEGYKFNHKYGPYEVELDERQGEGWVSAGKLIPVETQPSLENDEIHSLELVHTDLELVHTDLEVDQVELPDINLSIKEMESELEELTQTQLEELIKQEINGQNRVGMLKLLRKHLTA